MGRREGKIAFAQSVQIDPSKALSGGTPFAGDLSSTGILIPSTPTASQSTRYFFQLCATTIPTGTIGIIRNIRQLLYIGASLVEEQDQPDGQWLLEIPVTDPLWCFADGNVSWHLRVGQSGSPDTKVFFDAIFGPPYSNRRDTTDSALLARTPDAPYTPLNAGMPYGKDLAGLGTFRDIRYPWAEDDTDLGIEVKGPNRVALYASVHQTNPANRPNKPVGIETAGLRPEDVFVLNYPQARYTRVGGRMKVEFRDMDEKQIRGCR